ncbi:hypothetical protein EDD18DRAFT_1107515 [Armillaria luteobubalina]|uniref:NGN domain-containing protein n=1 Tax=Armillaria luteobubalina TaxID=153913 RepID=A0AA39ULA2_9AGAR|nr:hypothetical protein EDD18DRAFT_1107515 [Armillaria luteobubalina]
MVNTVRFWTLKLVYLADDEVDSPYEDDDESFIAEEEDSDVTTDSTAFKMKVRHGSSFLERARSRANRPESSLETDVRSDIGLFDVPASELLVLKCFCGWEEIVVLHIGRCARPELGIKAAFIMPLVEEKSSTGTRQVLLHAISSEDSQCCWVKVSHGRSRGNVGIVSKMYPWGCKVLLAPKLELPPDMDKQRRCLSSQSEPKLFNVMAIEKAGHRIEIATEITEKLAYLFAQSGHPLVGEVITDISRHISGTVHTKEFEIGTYVEITREEHATRWSGWVHAIDNGLLHLISRSGPDNKQIEICRVHPNSVSAISPPHHISHPVDSDSEHSRSISIIPWKGVMVHIVKHDVNIVKDAKKEREVLLFLVQLSHYDPNAPFISLWFHYLDIVDEELWLPLNEARPIVMDTDLFHNLVPDTNVLGKRGRRVPPEPVA